MYIYIDESGEIGSELPGRKEDPAHERIFILGALVVRRNDSRVKIRAAAQRARREQLKSPKHRKCLVCAKEIKGEDLLPKVHKDLLRRLGQLEGVEFYALVVDKANLRARFAKKKPERYRRIVIDLLARIRVHKGIKRVRLIVDRGGSGDDWGLRLSLITSFKRKIKTKGVDVEVRVVASEHDRCVQVADVLTHFVARRLLLGEAIEADQKELERLDEKYFGGLSKVREKKGQLEKRLEEYGVEWGVWMKNYKYVKDRVHVWKPRVLHRKEKVVQQFVRERSKTKR